MFGQGSWHDRKRWTWLVRRKDRGEAAALFCTVFILRSYSEAVRTCCSEETKVRVEEVSGALTRGSRTKPAEGSVLGRQSKVQDGRVWSRIQLCCRREASGRFHGGGRGSARDRRREDVLAAHPADSHCHRLLLDLSPLPLSAAVPESRGRCHQVGCLAQERGGSGTQPREPGHKQSFLNTK